jgi:hypothetical protein
MCVVTIVHALCMPLVTAIQAWVVTLHVMIALVTTIHGVTHVMSTVITTTRVIAVIVMAVGLLTHTHTT